ncbi:unnamed protein product, partial [Mesorhabditis spiculigera]
METYLTVTEAQLDPKDVAKKIIAKLGSPDYLSADNNRPIYSPSADDVKCLCESVKDVAENEEGVAKPRGRTIVVGDLHGNFNDLWRIIHAWLSDVVGGGPGQNIMFLGDIVDRGPRQIECLILIMAYKALFPYQVWIVRGNHEEANICGSFQNQLLVRGYRDDKTPSSRTRKSDDDEPKAKGVDAIDLLLELFESLPVVGQIDERIVCMHGMLANELNKKLLRDGYKFHDTSYDTMNRQLRWNDPCQVNGVRHYGQLWGPKAIRDVMEDLGVEFILRGHQAMTNGVRRFANLPLATVFSSSFYQDENFGAILYVDPEKNEIVPIFIVNHNDKIETQKDFDEELREGWKVDDYAVIPEDITMKGMKK